MKTFPTSVGTEYTFFPPQFEIKDIKTDDLPAFVDGKGKTIGIDMKEMPEPLCLQGKEQLPKMPLPTERRQPDFQKSVSKWFLAFSQIEKSVVLPVPMGYLFKRPGSPHIPTPLEKIKGTLDYRLASKSFSVKETHLYPVNYMQMYDSIISGDMPSFENFEQTGPRGEKIPFLNHFSEKTPWSAQLMPLKPEPYMYHAYEDYQNAMKNWIMKVMEDCPIIPMNPEQLQSIIKVEKQPQFAVKRRERRSKDDISASDYFSFVSTPPPDFESNEESKSEEVPSSILLSSFDLIPPSEIESRDTPKQFSPPKNEDFIAKELSGMLEVYKTTFSQKESLRNQPIRLRFSDRLPYNMQLYTEWSTFGPTQPLKNKLLARGMFESSILTTPSLPKLESAQLITNMCKELKDVGSRYILAQTAISLLEDNTSRAAIVTDIKCFYAIYQLFHEFTDCIVDMPIIYPNIPDNILIEALFHTLLNYYITNQIASYMESIKKISITKFLRDRQDVHIIAVTDIMEQRGDMIFNYISNNIEKYPGYLTQVVFLFLAMGNHGYKFMIESGWSFISFIIKLSEVSPETFHIFQLIIFHSVSMSSFVVSQLGSLNYYPNDLLKCKNDELLLFLCSVLQERYPKEIINVDVSWALLFCTMILNQNQSSMIPPVQLKFFYSVVIYIQNRIWANPKLDQWNYDIPQLITTIFTAMQMHHDEETLYIILKAFRRISGHPVVCKTALKDLDNILDIICKAISSNKVRLSCGGIKTIKYLLFNNPPIIDVIVGNKKYLQKLGDSLFLRNEESLLEIFKMLKVFTNHPNFSKIKGSLQKILIASHFRFEAAKSTVFNKAQGKNQQKYKKFAEFLEKNSQMSTILKNVNNILMKQKY